jgi:hypothetical protein
MGLNKRVGDVRHDVSTFFHIHDRCELDPLE